MYQGKPFTRRCARRPVLTSYWLVLAGTHASHLWVASSFGMLPLHAELAKLGLPADTPVEVEFLGYEEPRSLLQGLSTEPALRDVAPSVQAEPAGMIATLSR